MATKQKNTEKNNFDAMTSKLTKEERSDMLNKMSPDEIEITLPQNAAKPKNPRLEAKENRENLKKNFTKETVVKKFCVWVKSLLFNKSIEESYNDFVLKSIAKQLERNYPGLLNYRQRFLKGGFMTKLTSLKSAQEYFNVQLSFTSKDSGVFYYMLASVIMPEFIQKLKSETDPFQYNYNKPLSNETRNFLLSKLDDNFNSMTLDMKNKMSTCAVAYEWLKMFSKLPITNILSKFSRTEAGQTCLFVQLKNDFSEITKVLSTIPSFQDVLFKALYISTKDINNYWTYSIEETPEEDILKNNDNSHVHVSVIDAFITSVPMKDLCKIVYENCLYSPGIFAPTDNWLQSLKDEVKILFDYRWKIWNREFQKENIKKKLKLYFNLLDFPKFIYHPWTRIEEFIPFKYGYVIGFLHFYFKQEYQKYGSILNVVTLEGDFALKDNRHEFMDTVGDFNTIPDKLDILADLLSANGEYGQEFLRFDVNEKHNSNSSYLKTIISDMEDKSKEVYDLFLKCTKAFDSLILALLGEKTTATYGPLTNLSKIMGRENRKFRETLERFAYSIKYATEVITTLRDIDNFVI